MSDIQHLSNAPIEEAVVEIRVTKREDAKVEELEPICARVSAKYPKKLVNRQFAAHLKIAQEATAENVGNWLYGYRVESEPPGKVVQFNADVFSFSWLRPYKTWEEFVGEARTNWQLYSDVWRPTSVTRIGTRFINRLNLPVDGLDFDDYFTAFPRVPPHLPQTLVTFLSRIVVPMRDDRTLATISLALEDQKQDGVSVILDIDVSREAPNPNIAEPMWGLIESFRGLKNKAFFDSLTDKALKPYI